MTNRQTIAGVIIAVAVGVAAGMLWPRTVVSQDHTRTTSSQPGSTGVPTAGATRVSVERTSLVTTPGAPGYDAVRLIRMRDYRLGEVFELEPRDEAFAATRERDLTTALRDAVDALSLADAVHDLKVECRTATCELTIATDHAMMEEISAKVGLFPFGELVTPGRRADPEDPSRGLVSFVVAYAADSVSHDAFRAQYDDLLTKTGLTRALSMAGVPSGDFWKGDDR